jgi:hypothetical protein
MTNFNEAAVNAILDRVVSASMTLGVFDTVNQHEPKQSPGSGFTCAVWVDSIRPIRRSSVDAISGVLSLRIRAYTPFQQQPFDQIDPQIITAVSTLIGAFSADFDFGQLVNVRCIDIMGGEGSGEMLDARAGYLEIDRRMYRIMTIRLPVIVNDMWILAG